ncbi:hypothetical protein QVD17_00204 [Tagetes erecta]|uniref:Uncharacterized protein n=1 Tax=Tagetes erecta TaxID=13708 RepID=A0AAD8P767_TARER|nr:hypothetical protein QVD17_00204 [Tagetes erecta]
MEYGVSFHRARRESDEDQTDEKHIDEMETENDMKEGDKAAQERVGGISGMVLKVKKDEWKDMCDKHTRSVISKMDDEDGTKKNIRMS